MPHLDRIDRAILAALQNNARVSNKELAARVGLAPSSCLARVRRLEAEGVVERYRAELDAAALGLGLQALIAVQLRVHVGEAFGSIGDHLRSLPETVAVYCLGGATDFLVHVACRDTEHLRVLTLRSFTSRPEVSRIETSIVFSFSRSSLAVGDEASGPLGPCGPAPRSRRATSPGTTPAEAPAAAPARPSPAKAPAAAPPRPSPAMALAAAGTWAPGGAAPLRPARAKVARAGRGAKR